jgi:endonuclease/exonuclease/phosphatase (EEP) superfamily protein YafD
MEDDKCAKTPIWQTSALVLSAGLWFAASICYWFQPDWMAALTLVPAWCWLLPALVLFRLGFDRRRWRLSGVLLLLWIAFVMVFAGDVRSFVHFGRSPTADWIAAREQGRAIRVVSLNCRLGDARAAAEVAQYDPDIVLLQESPSLEEVEELAHRLYGMDGSALWDFDTSILARGEIEPRTPDRALHFTHGFVRMPGGLEVDVVSLRLNPPVARLDFWAPGFWRDHRDNRVKHREQIQEVMEGLGDRPEATHLIVGGDFNAPAGDGALGELRPRVLDTFREAGRGWGNTGTNRFPLFRVDQVWASQGLRAESVTARRTIHSDHRLVICDLVIEE